MLSTIYMTEGDEILVFKQAMNNTSAVLSGGELSEAFKTYSIGMLD